jgi:hypothetical protein
MSTPVCPIHGKAMRSGNKGGYFCATKLPDGSWCKEKAHYEEGDHLIKPRGGETSGDNTSLAVAALQFAGALCQGQGPESLSDALACAAKAYELGQHLGGK